MKYKFLMLSLILAGASVANAQDNPKFTDNLFVGAGVGTMAVFNDGLNSPTFNMNIQVGKYITPTWGVRGVLSGGWQSLEKQNNGFSAYCKKFVPASAKENPIIKEVVKEKIVPGPRAIFFKIGSAKIDCFGMVDIRLAAEELKANPDKKYRVVGYADKATGSVQLNQTLTEKRAKAVYDALIAEGVNKDQVEYIGAGGTDNMFFDKDHLNRVVIMK